MKRLLVILGFMVFLCLVPLLFIYLSSSMIRLSGNQRSVVFVDDYKIVLLPFCYGINEDGVMRDSCVLVISDVHNESVTDTLVYYPHLGATLNILISDNNQWRLVDRNGDSRCSSHWLSVSSTDSLEIGDDVNLVLALDAPDGMGCFRLLYYRVNDDPPFYSQELYYVHKPKRKSINRVAEARVGDQIVEWDYTYLYNYALLRSKDGVVTDTLRWPRSTLSNSWSFMMVGDTIIMDDCYSIRPSCTSPLMIIRRTDALFLKETLREYDSEAAASQEPPTVLVQFIDKPSRRLKESIQVTSFNLSASPTRFLDISSSFLNDNVFIIQEQ